MLPVGEVAILVPMRPEALASYAVVRAALDPTAELATIFLARDEAGASTGAEWGPGALLVARRVPGHAAYATVVWHDWFLAARRVIVEGVLALAEDNALG